MKFCIVSDLHCKYQLDQNSSSETLLFSNKPRVPANHHPVAALLNAIGRDQHIQGDVLLCLGDLGDCADEQGIISAWSSVEEIQIKLGSGVRIGIPGNHDVNSRGMNGKDPFTYIKTFHESFPTSDSTLNSMFWGQGFCKYIEGEVLYLLINSVHDHSSAEKAAESNISSTMLEAIESDLNVEANVKLKLCLIHHHPIKHSNIHNYKDGDSVDNGDKLLDLLNSKGFNIVLHGHKHQPRIVDYNGLPIFAVGSFSSIANLQGTGLSTMFHVLELMPDTKMGIIKSWEYNIKDGWMQSNNRYFPFKIGFGAIQDIDSLATRINDFMKVDSMPKLYTALLQEFPELGYMMPDKLVQLEEKLKSSHFISMSPNYPLMPSVVTFTQQ